MKIDIKKLSGDTRKKLVRYAQAVKQYELERRKIYFRDGGYLEIPPSGKCIDEWSQARADLKNCRETEIKNLVHRIQIERVNEAMTQSELAARRAADNAKISEN